VEIRKLTLDNAVDLREKLDREIHENYQILVSNNSLEKNKNKYDIRELLRTTELMETQVIRLKEAIQQANLKRHQREKQSNSYYIYRLSQLKIKRDNFMKMSTKHGKFGKKIFEAIFRSPELTGMIKDIHEEIDKITQKLSKFNISKKNEVKVQFEKELLYLL